MMNAQKPELKTSELNAALHACRTSFIYAGFFSMFINILMLVPTLYMLQLYGRVLTSRSVETLVMLTIIAMVLFITMGILEVVRSRILVRVGNKLDHLLSNRVFDAIFDLANRQPGKITAQPLNDLTSLRQFLTGTGPFAFFDAPWMPIYIAVLFLFHPVFGYFAIGASIILFIITLLNEKGTKKGLEGANALNRESTTYISASLRNAEVIQAMGMKEGVRRRWLEKYRKFLSMQTLASDVAGFWANLSKTMRIMLQSLILGLGGYLAVIMEVNPGMMIAGSIVMGRALAPLDLVISGWRGFSEARASYWRLEKLLHEFPEKPDRMLLPTPKGSIQLENVFVVPPQATQPALRGVNLNIAAGEIVAVIGPSAAGKSTLARAMLGVWPLHAGKVRLDNADLDQWDNVRLGRYLGYLPQDIELFEGTVGENISRFGDPDPEGVVAAGEMAGVHDMILHLPEGYDTKIGAGGMALSGGQRQRVGLARALYGKPALVVLDEPNSNLDDQGEKALVEAIKQLKKNGTTVIVITHRVGILSVVDKIAMLAAGQLKAYGPRDEVLNALAAAQQQTPQLASGRPQLQAAG